MRRGTLVTIIFLLLLITGAAVYQLRLANEENGPLPGPVSPGQMPEVSP